MPRTFRKLPSALLTMVAVGWESAHAQKTAGPQGLAAGVIRGRRWLIPAQDKNTLMCTKVARPPGDGPFSLAVISHSTAARRCGGRNSGAWRFTAL